MKFLILKKRFNLIKYTPASFNLCDVVLHYDIDDKKMNIYLIVSPQLLIRHVRKNTYNKCFLANTRLHGRNRKINQLIKTNWC